MWQIKSTPLADAQLITMPAFHDFRGSFIKTFQHSILQDAGIDFELKESYFSVSGKDVIRGMHFQLPPFEHSKIVYCPQGAILDVIIDLRKGSPTYGSSFDVELTDSNHRAVYIPIGFAHGFKSLVEDSMTYYLVTSEYTRDHDTGIRFDSVGYDWGCANPVISDRDLSFPALESFDSPFVLSSVANP